MIILYKGQIGARPRSVLVGFDGLIGRMMISRLRPADFAQDDRKRSVFDMTSKGLSMR